MAYCRHHRHDDCTRPRHPRRRDDRWDDLRHRQVASRQSSGGTRARLHRVLGFQRREPAAPSSQASTSDAATLPRPAAVANMSLGGFGYSHAERRHPGAVDRAWRSLSSRERRSAWPTQPPATQQRLYAVQLTTPARVSEHLGASTCRSDDQHGYPVASFSNYGLLRSTSSAPGSQHHVRLVHRASTATTHDLRAPRWRRPHVRSRRRWRSIAARRPAPRRALDPPRHP